MINDRNHSWWHYSIPVAGLLLAGWLFQYTTDREYINLAPTEGRAFSTVLESVRTYEQQFIPTRTSISRFGLRLQPQTAALPPEVLVISLHRNNETIGQAALAADFLDSEGFSQVKFSPAIPTTVGESLTMRLVVPPSLDRKISIQHRERDSSFNSNDVNFLIDGEPQSSPVAYQVYYYYRPPLAITVGVLILIAMGWWLAPQWWQTLPWSGLYPLLLALLFVLPALLKGGFPLVLMIAVVIAATGMMQLLRAKSYSLDAQILGATIFSLTSYFSLHAGQGQAVLLVGAAFPWLVWWLGQWRRSDTVVLWGAAIVIVGVMYAGLLAVGLPSVPVSAAPKEILLDPNQVYDSYKVMGTTLPWHHFGSYAGFINVGLALIGLLTRGRRTIPYLFFGSVLLLVTLSSPLAALAAESRLIPTPYLIIFVTFAISFYAANGLIALKNYLGDTPAVAMISGCLIGLSLLDLLFVGTTTLEALFL